MLKTVVNVVTYLNYIVFIVIILIYRIGWNGVSGCAFLCLMSEPLHEANSICKARISQKCAMRSRKNTHDFTVFGVVPTPYLPNASDQGFSGLG